MKKYAPFLLLLLLLLAIPARAEPPVQQSLVHLYGIGTDPHTGKRARWTGTGFAVGPAGEESDVFLTNWHVATGGGEYADGQVELWLLKDGARLDSDLVPLPGSAVRCRVLLTTDGYPDVAVIQALSPVEGYRALPLLPSRQVAEGTRVYALGFPGLQAARLDSGPEDVRTTAGTVRRHLVMQQAGDTRVIIHDAPLEHGFSGGPLVEEQGAVVGLNAYGFEEDVSTELFCAVSIDYAMELLDRLSLPYTRADGPGALTTLTRRALHALKSNPALAALPLLAAAALLLGLRLGRRSPHPEESKEECPDEN